MEVPQPYNIVKFRKRWSDFLLEFLMVFLAVFLGFVAERIRENNVEQRKARENARTLLLSIVGDTTELNDRIIFYRKINKAIDTLAVMIVDKNIQQKQVGLLYYLASKGMWNKPYSPNKASLEQLKSSGSLRYFSNIELINTIEKYDQNLNSIQILSDDSFTILNEARKFEYKIFNSRIPKGWIEDEDSLRMVNQRNLFLNSYDPSLLNEFANWATTRREHNNWIISTYENTLYTARHLIALLKNEYDIN